MLKTLSEAFGASGAEQEVRDYIKNAVESICDDVYTDNMGNLICFKKGKLKAAAVLCFRRIWMRSGSLFRA